MKKIYLLFLLMLVSALSFGQVINEVDADTPGTDTAEFVEIKWTPNTALDGLVVVFWNGGGDVSYAAYDLDGMSTDANGFFIIGNAATSPDITIPSNGLQNGADAVGIYTGSDTDFPNGTAVTGTNLLSGVVYDTNDGDDTGLLAAIGGVQYNDRENSLGDTESVQRKMDGTYETKAITLRAENDAATCNLGITGTSAVCDNVTSGTDTYTASFMYSGGATATYTLSSDVGDIAGDNPDALASGTITVSNIPEGTNVTLTVMGDGGVCNFTNTVTAAVCVPALTLPLYEAFDYTVGADLSAQANWDNVSTSSDEIKIATGNLSYPGFAASNGASITYDGVGSDTRIAFEPVTSGEFYSSFLLKVTDLSAATNTNGGYTIVLGNFDTRLWLKTNGGAYDIGLSNGGSTTNYTTSSYNVDDTLLVVLSYNIASGVMNAWINPSDSTFGGSAPAITLTDTDGSPSASISQFLFRQDSAGETPFITIDELRLGTNWADVTPNVLGVNTFSNKNAFSIYPNPVSNGLVNIASQSNDAINVTVFDILGKQVLASNVTNNTLNVSKLKTGVYILNITQNNNTTTKKLVIK